MAQVDLLGCSSFTCLSTTMPSGARPIHYEKARANKKRGGVSCVMVPSPAESQWAFAVSSCYQTTSMIIFNLCWVQDQLNQPVANLCSI